MGGFEMNAWLILLAAVCCGTGIGAVACARLMIRRSNLRLEKMVQAAMEGSFQEERFDEDIHSAKIGRASCRERV